MMRSSLMHCRRGCMEGFLKGCGTTLGDRTALSAMVAAKVPAAKLSSNGQSFSTTAATASPTVYKFSIPPDDLEIVKATLPAVAESGTDLTKHFYSRMFGRNPELLNLFNQTNQAVGGQPKKLLKTVAVAAQAAIDTGELPAEVIEGICHKHAALDVSAEAYNIVGENLLGTVAELLSDDEKVLHAWGALYKDIAGVFIQREEELKDQAASEPGGWSGKREFRLTNKEKLSETVQRFTFEPVDGGQVPIFKPGKYTTIWVNVNSTGIFGPYAVQPRHYTLNTPRSDEENTVAISVKKQGLVSAKLHDEAEVGSTFHLSPPYGCFDLSGVEKLWLSEEDAPVIFLSGGIGITPVLAMLENIYVTRPATWLHASQNGAVHAYRDRMRQISAVRHGELQRRVWYDEPTEQDGPPGGNETDPTMFNLAKYHYQGRMDLQDVVHAGGEDILHLGHELAQYYMCGPPAFMEAQRESLMKLGVEGHRIHWEGFG